MKNKFLRSNGQSLVEFAIILPFTVVLVLGVIESGIRPARSTRGRQADARGVEPDLP